MTEAASLADRIRRAAHEHGPRPALTFLDSRLEPTTYSYAEVHHRTDELAQAAVKAGVRQGSLIGILLSKQEDQVLHYLALLQLGAVPAILTPPNRKLHREYYDLTMSRVLDSGRFGAVVTEMDFPQMATPLRRPYTFEAIDPAEASTHDAFVVPETVPFLQFSSGTTGIKRGVLITDQAVLAQLERYGKSIELESNDHIISWLPLYHDMGFIACLNLPLVHGAHTVMIDPIDWVARPSLLLHAISRFHGTYSWNPNFAYAFMAQRCDESEIADLDLSSLRGLVNCSEPVSLESQWAFRKRFERLGLPARVFMGCYAMAETTFALTSGLESDENYLDTSTSTNRVSVGRPLEGVSMQTRDDCGDPLGNEAVGEIWVKSPFNFIGYHNDPDANKNVIVDGWYLTGDLGYSVDGEWFVVGRSKDILIVGGVNVYPQDVEAIVSDVDGVQSGRVVAFSHFDAERQTERVVVLAESTFSGIDARAAMTEARQRLRASLDMANFHVELVPPGSLVKSTAGKMARSENKERWLATRRK